jgi:RecB family exonuclease
MTDIVVIEALGELLSPSQVSTYMTCPAKWYFRYLIGLSEPTTGAQVLGKAFSRNTGSELPSEAAHGPRDGSERTTRSLLQEWSSVIAAAACRDDEDADAATRQVLVTAYLTETAPPVRPRAIEQTVQGEIAGVRVRRIVDLLDTEGRVLDFKTASRRPNGVAAEHSLQLTTYAMITPGAGGLCRLDTVTKSKTVQMVQQSYQVGAEDRRFAETLCPMVQESIRDGIYPPHRSSPMSSRRYCGYWRECEREFGGRVADQLRARVYATDSRIPSRFHLKAADPRRTGVRPFGFRGLSGMPTLCLPTVCPLPARGYC